jgi:hypothetical protein
LGEGQEEANTQEEVVNIVIFIFSTEAERDWGKGRRRSTLRERSSLL